MDIEPAVRMEAGEARQALKRMAAEGPVPVVILGNVPGLPEDERDRLVADALARGVRGLDVAFAPVAAEDAPPKRVVVAFNPPPAMPAERLCERTLLQDSRTIGNRQRLAAAFCDARDPLGAASGVVASDAPAARERLLWRVGDALFPDDYEESYGFDLLPDWLDVGVGGSVGF